MISPDRLVTDEKKITFHTGWRDFLKGMVAHMDQECASDSDSGTFHAELELFLRLPFCRFVSLFLLHPQKAAFVPYLTCPSSFSKESERKFERLNRAGKIVEAVRSPQGFSVSSSTSGRRQDHDCLLSLTEGGDLLGLLILSGNRPVESWDFPILPLLRLQTRHLAQVIRTKDLARQLRHQKSLLRQRITQRTVSLEKARIEIQHLLDSVQTGIIIIDRETGRIMDVNRTALDTTGYHREVLLGAFCRNFCLVEEDPCPFFRGGETKFSGQIETSLVNAEGQPIPVLKSANPIVFNGRPALVENWVDLRERKKLEQAFLQSQKLEAVGRLAGGVAHDFNNLLMAIMGYCDLSLSDLSPESLPYRYVEEISKVAERAAGLTRQLLALSRQKIQHFSVINLNTVLTDIKKMLLRLIGEDIVLTTRLDDHLGLVKADKGQLEQIILNLTVNARDAMPQGGNLIFETYNFDTDPSYLEKHPIVAPGAYVVLAVSDNGVGMDPETRDRIFEPFFTTKGPAQGTGLGMSTVYNIVKQSGGYIWVYSEKGHGTTIKIYLPRVSASLPLPPTSEKSQSPPRGFETVLLIEDEPMLRSSIKESLEAFGYRVFTAADGDQALTMARHFPETIHLILTDLILPGKSGKETAESLLRLHPESTILYMSGYTDDLVIQKGLLTEKAAFLQKPFTPSELAFKVREILDRQPRS
jgi:PAS domain S-box-containing protein